MSIKTRLQKLETTTPQHSFGARFMAEAENCDIPVAELEELRAYINSTDDFFDAMIKNEGLFQNILDKLPPAMDC